MAKENKLPRSVRQLEPRTTKTTWILLMQRGKAKLLKQTTPAQPMELVEGFVNPAGTMQTSELVSSKPGRIDRPTEGMGGHAAAPAEDAHEHAVTMFAKSLAERLEGGIVRGECDRIVVAAEPHCLGKLKGELGKNSLKNLHGTIAKDLFHVSGQELHEAISELNG